MISQEEGIQHPEPEPEPRIIGLTGGIGSGKSTVATFIEALGFPVYNSDTRAKSIVTENSFIKEQIIALLGEKAYKNETYNTKFVAEKIFENDNLRQQLNQIIHPAVKEDFENWVSKHENQLLFKETALLFELKINEQCSQSVLVTAEENIRIKRVMDRDDKTYREVENVILKQMPEKEKRKLADYIIENNSDVETLEIETKKMIEALTN